MRSAAALPAVLFVLAISGAMVVGGVFVTRQLAATVRSDQQGAELLPAAEGAIVVALSAWDSTTRAGQSIGSTQPVLVSELTDMRLDVWVTRLGPILYWLVGQAVSNRQPPLRRRVNAIVELTTGNPRLVLPRAWSELP